MKTDCKGSVSVISIQKNQAREVS